MKIVLCCRVHPTHRPGGMPFVLEDRAEALHKLGHDVLIITTGTKNRPNIERLEKGLRIVYANSKPEEYSREYAAECYALCKDWMPDIVHLDSFDVQRPWYLELPKSVKTAVTLHGFGWGAALTKWNLHRLGLEDHPPALNNMGLREESKALGKFGTVIGISQHEAWMLRELYGLPAKLVYNPIPSYFFDPPKTAPPTPKRFLCAAVSGAATRMFDLAKEAAKIADVELVVKSSLPRTHMPFLYDSCTALVVPTGFSQGYDLTVAESLARGRPVIASNIGSYAREAVNTPGIFTFPLGDKNALAKLMRSDLSLDYPDAACKHRPEVHAANWLEAVCG